MEDDYREKLKKVNEKVFELNKEVEMMELQIECFKDKRRSIMQIMLSLRNFIMTTLLTLMEK